MIIGLGADPFGVELKESVKRHLEMTGYVVQDLGGSNDRQHTYYDVAHEIAEKVGSGTCERGVLVCGTGMDMAIVANKHPGVYAAVCEDVETATKARSINNANVLTLGGMVIATSKANEIVDAFLSTEFKSGWGDQTQVFLDQSMLDIQRIESEKFK